jgi:hypothetical protein
MITNAAADGPVTPATLDRWAIMAMEAHEAAGDAKMRLLETRADLPALADVTRARGAAWKVYHGLLDAGAAPVQGIGVPTSANPLCALANADTPNARELLWLLNEALTVAERVDAERGNVLPDDFPLQPGESRGTDLAGTLSELALRLRVEVEGPTRQRGRE